MTAPLIHAMLNSRSQHTRDLARQLARGRMRNVDPDLQEAIRLSSAVARRASKMATQTTPSTYAKPLNNDGDSAGAGGFSSNAGAATSADFKFVPTYNSVPKARKKILGF